MRPRAKHMPMPLSDRNLSTSQTPIVVVGKTAQAAAAQTRNSSPSSTPAPAGWELVRLERRRLRVPPWLLSRKARMMRRRAAKSASPASPAQPISCTAAAAAAAAQAAPRAAACGRSAGEREDETIVWDGACVVSGKESKGEKKRKQKWKEKRRRYACHERPISCHAFCFPCKAALIDRRRERAG